MEPNERHHHHHHHQDQQQHLTSSYYNPFNHNPTTVSATTSAGNSIPSSNNGNLQIPNDVSSSSLFSVPSSAVNVSIDPVKRKRGRPRKYETPAQALAAKKLASSASNSSARERREQAAVAAAAGVSPPVSKSGSRKSLLGSVGKTGQSFIPHIVNITPGEDVAEKIVLFAQQTKHELCVLSASGSISNASLSHLASGTSVSYEGQYEILSLSGSYIRGEHGGKTGGLSVCLSSSDGQIFGGGVGGHLKAAGPVQVILGTFQLEKKKDGRNGVKGDDASGSGNMLPSPGAESLLGYHPGMESSGRNPNDEHHTITSSALGGGAHFMMQPPQGMHMAHPRPSEWGGTGYDLSGLRGNGSSENEDYE
ncbi:PREDICTED: AT-hook motif nuclear-localized protein 14-like [Camelina sativa]|uniref:AT-hook motif nuclear-localized protein n=1 Tax=Camelina sativa TaxID=90675 RepID=A0ABM0VF04_CAMSA|nr:PREDICTED: AT-hook motif nuclear-localized protein 14-like [Camelina sativa]